VSPTKTDERIQMPLECKLTGVGDKGTMYARNMPYTRPTPSRDENGKEPGRNRIESRQREHRKGERNGRNVKRCIAWEAGNGRQREEM